MGSFFLAVLLSGGGRHEGQQGDQQHGDDADTEDESFHTFEKSRFFAPIEPPRRRGMKKGPVDVWSGHSIQRDPVLVLAPAQSLRK